MQGRLCDLVDGQIQAFPWRDWEIEFKIASNINIHLLEWTLDQERLYENPLMTGGGQNKIRKLCQAYDIFIPSITGDCFMQQPFWKLEGEAKIRLQMDFVSIVRSCGSLGIRTLVVPLVDNGCLETIEQENVLVDFLLQNQKLFELNNVQIVFESDFTPNELARFIRRLPYQVFGINYDIGNSAALGFNVEEEFEAYGLRIVNVHVKDRVFGGTTVPLKAGDADFDSVFLGLKKLNYQGNFILQTARSVNGNHVKELVNYQQMTNKWMEQYNLAM